MNADTTLARAFERAHQQPIDEPAVFAAIGAGLTALLKNQPLRYLSFAGTDPMLAWWLAPVLPLASRTLPYLRAEPTATWFLACDGAACIGFGCIEVNRANLAILRHGFVLPDRRGAGIGSELLRRRLAHGDYLTVNGFQVTTNKETLPLYLKAGFKEAGRRGRYYTLVRGHG